MKYQAGGVFFRPFIKAANCVGGAAIEYIIVSTFATFMALAGIAAVSKVLREKLKIVEERLGVTLDLGLDSWP